LIDLLRLFFGHPVTGPLDQVNAEQTLARLALHFFERPR
jgi:hypothetical protein